MTHYEMLGGHRRMTFEELRSLWRVLSRELHPDKGGNAAAFAEVSVAWGILKDKASRLLYDRELAIFCDKCKACEGEGRKLAKQIGFTRREWAICAACGGAGYKPRKKK